eukprot:764663-Hanusia_phi.AAC.3
MHVLTIRLPEQRRAQPLVVLKTDTCRLFRIAGNLESRPHRSALGSFLAYHPALLCNLSDGVKQRAFYYQNVKSLGVCKEKLRSSVTSKERTKVKPSRNRDETGHSS